MGWRQGPGGVERRQARADPGPPRPGAARHRAESSVDSAAVCDTAARCAGSVGPLITTADRPA